MTTPSIILTPRRQAVPAGFESTLDVLVRVAAPDAPESAAPARAPLHLALVIDRSGSMSGEPLAEAKNAAAFVIDHLSLGDRAALIVFDDNVHTLMPLSDMSHRAAFRAAIAGIQSGGSTDLHGGWFAGAEALAPAATPKTISRVILLSDGCANKGLTEMGAITGQCTELAGTGVTTSTYGLGRNFNEALMIAMARAGHGNSYYGQRAADLMDPFREEFALLNALCARQLVLNVAAAPGFRAEILNDYPRSPQGGWRLPDLAHGAEAWAFVRLTVEPRAEDLPPFDLLSATVSYQDVSGEAREPITASLKLKALPAAVLATLPENELVVRRAGEMEAAKLQEQAREAAQRHDWASVDALLVNARALGADNRWISGVVAELTSLAEARDRTLFSKEASYGAVRMRQRMTTRDESDDVSLAEPLFLRRKSSQGKATPEPKRKK